MRTIAIVSIALACAMFTASITAKGKTVKLVVSGGGLTSPVEISGEDVAFANPWSDAFVSSWSAVSEPALNARHFEVSFYEQMATADVRVKYLVDYVPGAPGRGVIHLPGRGDPRYRANVSTIVRDGQDGKWFPASSEWERVVGSRLR